MKLVLCEKPSVGNTVAKILGIKSRKDGYIECEDYIVSWSIGHLVGLAMPEEYGKEHKKWDNLPILPHEWKYSIFPGTKKQFDIIKRLMNRKDVTGIVCATDAGREGELIFRLVYNEAGCNKPIERLWISSLEDNAIKNGFASLHKGADFDNLYQSALCRERADWLIGMNLSRYFTTKNNKVFSIGRVQTPTLSMICTRDDEIKNFKKGYFYTVDLECGGFTAKSKNFEDKTKAETLCNGCENATVVSVKRENKFTAPPKLYDLTSLQREANKHFGFTAQQTLNIVQKLYEAKLVTYPRTDSCFLTEDMEATAKAVIQAICNSLEYIITENPSIKPVMNNKKVSDHHAIIPTVNISKSTSEQLTVDERKILGLIALRLLVATAPKEEYESVKVELESNNERFTATGKTVIKDGFKAIERQFKNSEEKETTLPDITEGSNYKVTVKVTEHVTQPPKVYTEDTLLSAMEKAGGKDFFDDVERTGLGTPATRASIIETLVKRKYIERKGKNLISTTLGKELINIAPESLTSPTMTVEWENELAQIAHGKTESDDFMEKIENFIKETVNN